MRTVELLDQIRPIWIERVSRQLARGESVRESFAAITAKINTGLSGSSSMTPEQVALGFIEVANETMARPIREISVARGYDLKDHVLACFGGAGAQHATAIARMLGIPQVFIHRFAGILSAYGLGLANVVVEKQQPASDILQPGSLLGRRRASGRGNGLIVPLQRRQC